MTPLWFEPDDVTEEVLDLVEARFGNSFRDVAPLWLCHDRGRR
jgi:deoxyribodipyrimidine photolyase-related protein